MRETAPDFDPFSGPAIAATCPTTEPQREIWAAARLGTEASLSYNESVTLRLQGPLDEPALRAALDALVARHEALRATISGDGLTLLVAPPGPAAVSVHDLTSGDAEDRLAQLLHRAVSTPFDLERGTLFRADLALLAADRHALVLTAHHIVVDGFSTAVLLSDLAALYDAFRGGQAAPLAPAESFVAHARAQAAKAASGERAAAESYWVKQMASEPPSVELPADRARPPARTQRSRRIDVSLDGALAAAIKRTAAKERASSFSALLAGFVALAHRLSGQEDVVVGVPAAGQSMGSHASLVGHCVNLLPLRHRVHGGQTAAELLAQVQRGLLDGLEHQELSFGALLKSLPLQRDPSRLPLVSVVFNLDRGLTPESLRFGGLRAELSTNPRVAENFDLFLNAVELPGEIRLECQYNADLYEAETVRRWLRAYELLLRGMAADPRAQIGSIAIAPPEDVRQIESWNDASSLEVARDVLVHELVEAQVARDPARTAVTFEGRSSTYGDLDARANRLARKLRAAGVGAGDLVGLCVDRGPDLLAGLLGILKSGAAYVPLDPGHPAERLSFMVSDARMAALVTETRLRAELSLSAPHTICLDADLDGESSAPIPRDGRGADAGSPAYVLYTSGSTGKPKGVLVPHRAAVNLIASVQRTPGMRASDVVLAITTVAFDIALSETILPLTVGARIAMASREVASDGPRLAQLIEQEGVTFIDATPATYRLLLHAGWQGGERLKLICTGDAMPRDLVDELTMRGGSVWNGYGPTETCVWSTFWKVPRGAARVLIGRPVANTRCHVLDARMQPVPIGVPGELYISGRGVALGYLGRDELTRERFLADPFAREPGARIYRTGDLARWLPDGDLECLGRTDAQVKLRGFRIELGEIESALQQHPAVAAAAAALREDKPGDKRITGYVVLREGASVKDAELKAQLKSTLPDYMVPAGFERLSKLPLTPSGKIDRRALPAPAMPSRDAAADFVEPRTESERLVAALWREALSVARVSVHDDFFALGGHSLLASQVLSRLRRDHGIELSFRTMFEAPTIARFAPLVETRAAGEKPAGIPRRGGTGPAALSVLQERLWLLEELDPSTRVVHSLPAAWRLRGPLDAGRLERALQAFVGRHDTLRTRFERRGGSPVQVIDVSVRFALDRRELREADLPAFFDAQMTEPFDLARAPLLRASLLRLGPDDHVLFTLRHNLIWDGWSFDIFLRELIELYAAAGEERSPQLPELRITYADFAAWHRAWLQGPEIQKQAAFWRRKLAGDVAPLDLPSDRPRPAEATHCGANEGIVLSKVELDALTSLARETGSTLFMVLFAAFNVLLHRWSGQRDLVVGTPVRARTQPETEDLVGAFINALPLRTKIDPQATFLELLARVREETLDAFGHQDVPLEALGIRPPPVRAFFSLQDARNRPPSLGAASVEQLHVLPPAAANDLMLWMMETKTGLLAMINFATDLFDAATARRFLAQLQTLLGEIVRDPRRAVSALPVVAGGELALIETFEAGDKTITEPAFDVLRDAADLLTDADALADEIAAARPAVVLAPREIARQLAGAAGAPVVELTLERSILDGRPARGHVARVLDERGGRCPIGVPGRLHLDGGSTEERARWRSDGRLELLDRADGKLRVFGTIIDPRAMAQELSACEGVQRAHVALRDGVLVAWFEPGGDVPAASQLRRYLRRSFPDAVLPTVFVPVQTWVDEARLPAPFAAARPRSVPKSDEEKLLAELFAEALGVQPSLHDNFFDLGGHSLLCFQVLERIEARTWKRLSPRILLLSSLEQAAAQLAALPAERPSRRDDDAVAEARPAL